jgi:glycerol-3-phosphate dehydrogenase
MSQSYTCDVLVIGGGATGSGLLRDLSRRGLRTLLVERADWGTGTTGRYHGLLHSGGRYVAKDALAARECIEENRILRRIAPASIEDTGGFFVSTPDDPDDYADAFPSLCAAADVDCAEVPVAEALRREPALNPGIKRVFQVPDGSIEPWNLIAANIADARAHGSDAWAYQRVVAMERPGSTITAVTLRDERSGSLARISPRFVVSASGAWAGQIAALINVSVTMHPGKGTMLIYNQRMTDMVVNRCHKPGDGDIMVPVHPVAILGTTEQHVEDPDRYDITRDEVAALVREGAKLFPELPNMRLLRAYAGVRPLYQPPAEVTAASLKDGRQISRAHTVLDHAERDGVDNLVTVVGGKLTTFRRMAQDAADMVCEKLGVEAPCTTADETLPDQVAGHTYWLGHRLAEHEAVGGGDANLICECEMVTRPELEAFVDSHPGCTVDDMRRGTRVGMGPCQGGFCTFRAAGLLAQRTDRPAAGCPGIAEQSDAVILGFLRERFKGTIPIASGRQLQEEWLVTAIYAGGLGLDSLVGSGTAAGTGEASHADR